MSQAKKVELPSGAVLEITPGTFSEGKDLYQTLMKEAQKLKIDKDMEMSDYNFLKDLFCLVFGSKEIEEKLFPCLKRCTYEVGGNKSRIGPDTFEPVDNRQDWFQVCFEVCLENVMPFMKGLFAGSQPLFATMKSILK